MSNRDFINIIERNKSDNNCDDMYKDDFYDYAKINNSINGKKFIIEKEEDDDFDSYDNYEKYNNMIDLMYGETNKTKED
jgi:hypothetical protein